MKKLLVFAFLLFAVTANAQIYGWGTNTADLPAYRIPTGTGKDSLHAIPAGTSGQVLISGGASAHPTWGVIALAQGFKQVTTSADTANATTSLIGSPLQFAIGASEVWEYDAYLATGSTTTNGIKIAIDVPTSATQLSQCFGSTTGVTAISFDDITADATAGLAFNTVNAQTGHVWIHGKVTNSTTAGNVIVDFVAPTTGTTTIRSGSFITARKVQ